MSRDNIVSVTQAEWDWLMADDDDDEAVTAMFRAARDRACGRWYAEDDGE